MLSELHRWKWISKTPEILSENLRHVRPESGLDVSIFETELHIDPAVEVLVRGEDVALDSPDGAAFPGIPRSTEEARKRGNLVKSQISKIQHAQLILGFGIDWGLVPAVLGRCLKPLNAIVLLLERSLERLRVALRLYDLRTVLESPDVFWCAGPDLGNSLVDLLRCESLYLIDRNRVAAVIAPGLISEESRYYQQAVSSAFGSVSADHSQVHASLARPVASKREGAMRIWTYVVPRSFHEPIVEAIASGFRMNDHHVEVGSASPSRSAALRFITHLAQARPDLLFLLNVPGADFVRDVGLQKNNPFIRSVCRVTWFVDNPAFYAKITPDSFENDDCVFWMDRSFKAELASSVALRGGFLPVASGMTREGEEVGCFRHPVTFVGNIADTRAVMASISHCDRRLLLDQVDRLLCGEVSSPLQCAREVVLQASSVQVIQKVVGMLRQIPLHGSLAVGYFLYVVANAEKRIRFLRPLIPLGIHVYGTDVWGPLLPELPPDRLHGMIGSDQVVNLYRSTLVNVSLHSYQCPTSLNPRDFDVLLSGGCLAADWVPDADAGLIEPGAHAIFVRDPETLSDTVAELLTNESKRREMAEAGREHALKHHTYAARTRELLRRLQE